MDDLRDYFGERVAATYDDSSEIFQPGTVNPVVEVLAELAASGRRRGAGRTRRLRAAGAT